MADFRGVEERIMTRRSESPESLATTRRAEEIRESTGVPWERACLQAERERDSAPDGLATIAYQAEAADSAADAFRRLTGWTVDVIPAPHISAEPFTATVDGIDYDENTGRCHVLLRAWDSEDVEPAEDAAPLRLDIWRDFARLEVV